MPKSILEKEYNRANFIKKDDKVFFSDVNVSYLDVLAGNKVRVLAKDYQDCYCKDSVNLQEYFTSCSKCGGSGSIDYNGHHLVCNECHGEKVIRIHDCYLCHNEGKILKDSYLELPLLNTYKDKDVVSYHGEGYCLNLTLNIYDKEDYLIKGKDIYLLRSIFFSELDNKNKVSKKVKTFKGIRSVSSKFEVNKEIVCLKGEGIDGGDFYLILENEIENDKKIIYTNVLINGNGYVSLNDLINEEVVEAKDFAPLTQEKLIYIGEDDYEYESLDYRIIFNRLSKADFILESGSLIYLFRLNKDDSNSDKKTVLINKERVTVNYKKGLKEELDVVISGKVCLNKQGKKRDFIVRVIPYFDHTYRITIKDNSSVVYLEDYKYDDYRLVETFTKNDYLEDYLIINHEDRLYHDNSLILIERV